MGEFMIGTRDLCKYLWLVRHGPTGEHTTAAFLNQGNF